MACLEFSLAGTGVALPEKLVHSDDLDAGLGHARGWLRGECGVAARYVCEGESQDELAARAAQAALRDAGVPSSQVDLLIFAAAVARQPIPSTAPLVARRLGIASGACATFDVNSTCLSFLNAFDIATRVLASGGYRCAVVVAAEIATRALPWADDPVTAGLFGDGAAAAVLLPAAGAATPGRARAARFETWHEGYELCRLGAGGTAIDFAREPDRFRAESLFRMNGHELFRLTSKHFDGFVARLLDAAGWMRADIDLVVPHQASPLALTHLVKRCGFPREKVVDIVASHGNQVSASIPTALHMARAAGRAPPGARVLVLGTSAGVSFGGMAIEV